MEINGVLYREFKIERLYFRYIYRTDLQKRGVTSQGLAGALEELGFIQLLEGGKRYVELPKFSGFVGYFDFKKLWEKPNGLLHDKLSSLGRS